MRHQAIERAVVFYIEGRLFHRTAETCLVYCYKRLMKPESNGRLLGRLSPEPSRERCRCNRRIIAPPERPQHERQGQEHAPSGTPGEAPAVRGGTVREEGGGRGSDSRGGGDSGYRQSRRRRHPHKRSSG